MTVPAFGRGGAAAEEAAKSGSRFARLNYFQVDDGKTIIVRFLTDSDDWYWVKQHPSVPTKNAPADNKGNWPSAMPAVCRHDKAFVDMYTDCYICDAPIMNPHDNTKPLKAALRVWALALEREAVVEGGVTKGYKTVMEELPERNDKGDETGKLIRQAKILVVNMGVKNFFGGLQGLYTAFGTVCDRDYMIRRTGSGLDTDYQIIPLDKTLGVEPGTETWAKFEKAIIDQGIDLGVIMADRATDEYYARFFDPSKSAPQQSSNGGAPAMVSTAPAGAPASEQAQTPQTGVVDPARLAAMRDRVRNTAAPAAQPSPALTVVPDSPPVGVGAGTGPVNFDA